MNPLVRRAFLITASFILAVGSALAVEWLLSSRLDHAFGHTQSGHVVGWVGLGLILLVFVYPIRKRQAPERRWPNGWFRVHMILGMLGPLLVLVHSGAHGGGRFADCFRCHAGGRLRRDQGP